jgi:hypothetical protein
MYQAKVEMTELDELFGAFGVNESTRVEDESRTSN